MLKIGDSGSVSKTISESDIYEYAGITGDFNPVHIDAVKAKESIFGERVAHGGLSVGLISAAIGTKMPGPGTVYLSQTIKFKKPVIIGDTITAVVTVKDVMNASKGIYKLETVCTNQNNLTVAYGEAEVKYIENDNYEIMHNDKITPNTSFYTEKELNNIGLKKYGKNVLISRNAVLYNPEKLEVGDNVRIDDFTTISGKVKLGDYIHIAQFCGLYGGDEGILMDDFSGLSSRVVIYATSNDYSGESLTNPMVPMKYKQADKNQTVHLEKHAIVGTTSVILPGVTIGIGSSVGAMSLVTKSLEPWGIYAGSPAKKIKNRSKHLLELEKQLREEADTPKRENRGGGTA